MNHLTTSERALAAAALFALAEQILHFSDAPIPQRIVMYRHYLTRAELLDQADQHATKIEIMSTCASTKLRLASLEDNGIEIDFSLFSRDMGPEDTTAYHDHNRNCLPEPVATQPLPPVGIMRDGGA